MCSASFDLADFLELNKNGSFNMVVILEASVAPPIKIKSLDETKELYHNLPQDVSIDLALRLNVLLKGYVLLEERYIV